MISPFRKLRMKLFPGSKLNRYLFYAIGEILLVVAGILIALSINNWNEERKQRNKVLNLFGIVLEDINNDSLDVYNTLSYYDQYKPVFLKIINGTMEPEEFAACGECAFLISGHRSFPIEKRGYEALNSFYSEFDQDTLVSQIVQFYTKAIQEIEDDNVLIRESIASDLITWRDKYDWFSRFSLEEVTPEYISYATSSKEYRNMMAWRYALIYGNYVGKVRDFQNGLRSTRKNILKRLGKA